MYTLLKMIKICIFVIGYVELTMSIKISKKFETI